MDHCKLCRRSLQTILVSTSKDLRHILTTHKPLIRSFLLAEKGPFSKTKVRLLVTANDKLNNEKAIVVLSQIAAAAIYCHSDTL